MLKYLLGFIKFFFYKKVSFLSLVDFNSKITRQAKINRKVKIYNSSVQSFSYIGSGSQIVHCEIGKFSSIARDCLLGLGVHSLNNISTSPIFTSKRNGTGYSWTNKNLFNEYQKTIIGNDVWIGARVIVMGGINIGDGAIVGAGSIVTKDIPNYAIAVGIPAKIIKYRFNDELRITLDKIKWWNYQVEKLKCNIELFQKENITVQDLMKLLKYE